MVIDFADPAVQKCPFPAYEALRDTQPIYRDPATGFYQVLDYDLVRQAATDHLNFSSKTGLLMVRDGPMKEQLARVYATEGVPPVQLLVAGDQPEHSFHRALIDKAFTPSRVRKMEDYLTGLIAELIARMKPEEEIDFVQSLAVLVPMSVMADQIGITRNDIPMFKRWSDAAVASVNPQTPPERQIDLAKIICELHRYLIRKAAEYREKPADCMLSDLVHANVDGRELDSGELVSIVQILLVAGNETTTNVMSSGFLQLILKPELQDELRGNLGRINNFVEEVLRAESPLQGMFRKAVNDVELGNTHIPAGSILLLRFGAANRDPKRFPEPDKFVSERTNARQHLAFGTGIHFCIGNQLARAELRIAFQLLLERMKDIRLARSDTAVVRTAHYFIYGISQLRFVFSDR